MRHNINSRSDGVQECGKYQAVNSMVNQPPLSHHLSFLSCNNRSNSTSLIFLPAWFGLSQDNFASTLSSSWKLISIVRSARQDVAATYGGVFSACQPYEHCQTQCTGHKNQVPPPWWVVCENIDIHAKQALVGISNQTQPETVDQMYYVPKRR